MKLEKIRKYKVDENKIFSDDDKKHVDNYKQLIKFFENAIEMSIKEKTVNYASLHNSCIQCVRFLDNLIFTYESSLQNAKALNKTLESIINDVQENTSGNENQSGPLM